MRQYLYIFLNHSGRLLLDYEISTGNIRHVIPEKRMFQKAEMRKNVPESWIALGHIHQGSIAEIRTAFKQIKDGKEQADCTIQIAGPHQDYQWLHLNLQVIEEPNGVREHAVCLSENITRQKEAEIAFVREEQYRKALISHALVYAQIDLTENCFIKYSGKEGWKRSPDVAYDEYFGNLECTTVHESDRKVFRDLFNRKRLMEAFEAGQREFSLEHRRINRKGIYSWVNSKLYLMKDPVTDHVEGLFYLEDIDSQKRESLLLQHNSEMDLLTNLYNKSTTEGKIKNYLQLSEPGQDIHGFLIMDVDDFKRVNDTLGHAEGDFVLKNIGYYLKKNFRSYDVVGRIGGDEFLIFMHHIPEELTARKGAEKICNAFHENKEALRGVSCSVGIALYPMDGTSFQELYEKADLALYRAKHAGKDTYVVYD